MRTISAESFESAPCDTNVGMVNIKTKTTMVARARMNNPDPNSILRNGENIGKKILFTQSCLAKLALHQRWQNISTTRHCRRLLSSLKKQYECTRAIDTSLVRRYSSRQK